MKTAIVTGSGGLIGSEASKMLVRNGYFVVGVDNDMRAYFFGDGASTKKKADKLKRLLGDRFKQSVADIRNEVAIEKLFRKYQPEVVIHTAAQPSHDWAATEPLTDFDINARATMILLENTRRVVPKATFIFTSTNKVYGDVPNRIPLVELPTRYEIRGGHRFHFGINETMSIDQSKHSLFGVSKTSADLMVQEYGRYFGMNTTVFRGGCLTGPAHSGAEAHGFLAYLVKCVKEGIDYTIYGYKGKQVRDQLHAYDLVNMFWEVIKNPKQGEVYNAGGGRSSNISVLEAIAKIETLVGRKLKYKYSEQARSGDHIWYISDTSKFQKDYPLWRQEYNINKILFDLCDGSL